MRYIAGLIFLLVLFILPGIEEGNIFFELDKEMLFPNEMGQITIIIIDPPQELDIHFPAVRGVHWGKPDTSLSYKVLNKKGEKIDKKHLIYQRPFTALAEGVYNIAGMKIQSTESEYILPNFQIHVEKPPVKPGFIKLKLSNASPYTGEQIAVKYQVYLANKAEKYAVHLPLFSTEEQWRFMTNRQYLSEEEHVQLRDIETKQPVNAIFRKEKKGSHLYSVIDIPFMITVTSEKKKFIPGISASFEMNFQDKGSRSFYFFHDLHPIEILPLPEPPETYRETAVGCYSISTEISRDTMYPGDPVRMELTIQGDGDLALISPPSPGKLPDFEDFVVEEDYLSTYYSQDSVSFYYTLRPKHQNIQRIPAIPFSYFNPKEEQYIEIRSRPHKINILSPTYIAEEYIPSGKEKIDEALSVPTSYTGPRLYADDQRIIFSYFFWLAPPLIFLLFSGILKILIQKNGKIPFRLKLQKERRNLMTCIDESGWSEKVYRYFINFSVQYSCQKNVNLETMADILSRYCSFSSSEMQTLLYSLQASVYGRYTLNYQERQSLYQCLKESKEP